MEHKTAIQGFIGGLWAVEESWLRSALNVLQGHRGEIPKRDSADLEALSLGERPMGTRYTAIQGRTAVIDVYGAIMPRANFFSDFSGGTSCQLLTQDIAWASASEDVDDILLAIHSPGGEVTGVSELAELIYQTRQKKDVTAYISGHGCSAAYWLASACTTIFANETSIVGSIGVMSVYLDDRKALENDGLEEIEFISSQSPYKNSPPWTDEGKKRIQARVDALADVFIENVARNRGVDAKTVTKEFGRGDVFVGAEAVKAGLVDHIGNFTQAFQKDPTLAVETSKQGAIKMAEKKDQPQGDENTVTVDKVEFEKMQEQMKELTEKSETQAKLVDTLKAEALEKEIAEITKPLAGETAKHVTVLTGIATALGKDSAEFKAYVETQTALTAQIEKSGLFKVVGSDSGAGEKTALEQLNDRAAEIVKDTKCSFADAFTQAAEEDPKLYAAYNAERQTAKAA